MTNVLDTNNNYGGAPVNQFYHARVFPPVDFKGVVRPCFDTLYSSAWLDLNDEPIILSVPDTHGRYYLMEMLDMWSDVFDAPGFRTTGTGPGNFAVVSPKWKGKLPEGVVELRAPTPFVWIIGRTETNGPQDYEIVHQIQAGYRLTPISRWGKPHKRPVAPPPIDPSVDNVTPPMDQVENMDGLTFFNRFCDVLKKNPPHSNDFPILHRMKAIGIEPGKDFAPPSNLDLDATVEDALNYMKAHQGDIGKLVNGWTMTTENIGTYGTSYLRRAIIALVGLGANVPEDAIYPAVFTDIDGKPLDGSNQYVLHFDNDQLPPVEAFWSVTLYDAKGFPVQNNLNRYVIADLDPVYNNNGSLDIYIGYSSPEDDLEANWLPAPEDTFTLLTRLYAPGSEILRGQWEPPALKPAE
jgi:hypothetical protein